MSKDSSLINETSTLQAQEYGFTLKSLEKEKAKKDKDEVKVFRETL